MDEKRQVVLFIAASLDGYIATEDESLEWLFNVEGEGDNGFAEFFETVDTVMMGRRTYEWVKDQEEEFPYKDKQCWVFTRTLKEEVEGVEFVNEDVAEFVGRLKEQSGKDLWMVGGGELLHAFLEARLIDKLIVTIAPVLLGKGIPLFRPGNYRCDLSLKRTRRFNQFVELAYEVK